MLLVAKLLRPALLVAISLVRPTAACRVSAAVSSWQLVPIDAAERAVPPADIPTADEAVRRLKSSEAVVLLNGLASVDECETLSRAASSAAAAHMAARRAASLPAEALVRLPCQAAAARAAAVGTPHAEPLPSAADALAETLLLRVLCRIDDELPSLRRALFADAGDLSELYCNGGPGLEFSSREPVTLTLTLAPQPISHPHPHPWARALVGEPVTT